MNIFGLIAVVAAFGGCGGFLNSVVAGELHFPFTDQRAKVWRPGWVGNILAGSGAAFVSWAFNGPLGGLDFFQDAPFALHFTPVQAASALLIGFGGGRFLTGESRRLILQHERDEEKQARMDVSTVARRKKRNDDGNGPATGT